MKQVPHIVAGLFLCGLPFSAGSAAERHESGFNHLCVRSLEGQFEKQGGLSTGDLARTVSFVDCEGVTRRLVLNGESEEISPWSGAEETDGEPADILSDGILTHSLETERMAWLTGPTRRYDHAILGDAIEASGLAVSNDVGETARLELDDASVFEDRRVRVLDLNGDGDDEFVVIRSYLNGGAALAVYGLESGVIVPLGETAAIGLSHRWLNPAGAADFDGDGVIEIAYVETPHIGGTLRFVSLTSDGLIEEQSLYGFSNHAIGSRELDMATVLDWNADGLLDLALPDAGRNRLQIVSLAGGKAKIIASLPEDGSKYAGRITTAVVASDLDGDNKPELLYGLNDGTLILAKP
ncbi:VCBS repeat-containing protein [Pelagibius sp. Alg239-R121]|uniref:FG-GAP repeat domain-containing protein n=1 Tax=Pelagibius sp. Alg239-R121 TaxID=2993448 RepID=UPI0024A703F0|nr:VCBS repeat-containing protein [Pelagibius sp. Alg239-R121]